MRIAILVIVLFFTICAYAKALPKSVYAEMNYIDTFMQMHNDLVDTLKNSSDERHQLFSAHRKLNHLMRLTATSLKERNKIYEWYRDLINAYPDYFKHSHIDSKLAPYLAQLRYQIWINLYESKINECDEVKLVSSRADRDKIAGIINFKKNSALWKILVKRNLLFAENDLTTATERKNLYRFLKMSPRRIFSAETIRIRNHLGMKENADERLVLRGGVNIFPGSHVIIVAHELTHTVNEYFLNLGDSWDLQTRKLFLLKQSAGPDIVFKENTFDLKATQDSFLNLGYWDGDLTQWDEAWSQYWQDGPGAAYNQNWLRQAGPLSIRGIPYFLKSPQEIVAGMANLYFASSYDMLNSVLRKWKQGYLQPINQFLLMAGIYSVDGDHTYFYQASDEKYLLRDVVKITRDSNGYINSLNVGAKKYLFILDDNGLVTEIKDETLPLV